jgi:hypothetical protein
MATDKKSFSSNELNGTLVLRNSIAEWLHLYSKIGDIDASIHITYGRCLQRFQILVKRLTEVIPWDHKVI